MPNFCRKICAIDTSIIVLYDNVMTVTPISAYLAPTANTDLVCL